MTRFSKTLIRAQHSAAPTIASAIVGAAYLVGAVVFSVVSQTPVGAVAAPEMSTQITLNLEMPVFGATVDEPVATQIDALPVAEPVAVAEVIPPILLPSLGEVPRIALIIDDIGLDLAAAERVNTLAAELTIAVLPYAASAPDVALEARRTGRDVLVHMPMEPLGLADPGPNALHLGLSDLDLQARTQWAFARVPGAIGLNNHMGSRFTQDPRAMRIVLGAVTGADALFIDSKTARDSRGAAVARGLGMPVLERDIFLDHVIDRTQIEIRLDEAETIARTRGWAVVIGHPHDETLDVLEAWLPEAGARGLEFVTVSSLSDLLGTDGRGEVRTSALQ
jgi:polysaccharide deacetylase 2 family uncharacterized protein YibQ